MATRKKNSSQQYESIDKLAVKPGMQVRVHQKIIDVGAKGEEKERIQVFEGLVLARKHGNEAGASITVRKISEGVGVEKIFPLNAPFIEKIEMVDQKITHRAKLYFTRFYKKRLRSERERKVSVPKGTKPKAPVKKEVAKEPAKV